MAYLNCLVLSIGIVAMIFIMGFIIGSTLLEAFTLTDVQSKDKKELDN